MDEVRIIKLKENILKDNQVEAEQLRQTLRCRHKCLINLMSSPGSGKTSLLKALHPFLQPHFKWGVMEADIDSDVDALTLQKFGIPSIQLHTGGMCHLDADMTRQGIQAFDRDALDLIFLENVGNLVCPAEFDTGAEMNMTILSVPEGDDKPAKYPLMYQKCQILIVNKIDTLPVFSFNKERMERDVKLLNPNIQIFYICAKSGKGMEELTDYLIPFIKEKIKER